MGNLERLFPTGSLPPHLYMPGRWVKNLGRNLCLLGVPVPPPPSPFIFLFSLSVSVIKSFMYLRQPQPCSWKWPWISDITCLSYGALGTEPRAYCMLGKPTYWVSHIPIFSLTFLPRTWMPTLYAPLARIVGTGGLWAFEVMHVVHRGTQSLWTRAHEKWHANQRRPSESMASPPVSGVSTPTHNVPSVTMAIPSPQHLNDYM